VLSHLLSRVCTPKSRLCTKSSEFTNKSTPNDFIQKDLSLYLCASRQIKIRYILIFIESMIAKCKCRPNPTLILAACAAQLRFKLFIVH
jgi:hypothetical protein